MDKIILEIIFKFSVIVIIFKRIKLILKPKFSISKYAYFSYFNVVLNIVKYQKILFYLKIQIL